VSSQIHLLAEERFHITGSRAVAFTLVGYIRDGEQFAVLFGDNLFVTQLLEVDDDQLIFDFGGAEALNQALLRVEGCRLSGRPDGVQVHFDVGRVSAVVHDGRPAFAVPLPQTIIRLQRRESFRIATPLLNPLRFCIRLTDDKEIELPSFDISLTGIGLLAANEPELTSGQLLTQCRFALPDEAQDIQLAARVQHITTFEPRTGGQQWRIGVHFLNVSPAIEKRLQRYIARLERERKELA